MTRSIAILICASVVAAGCGGVTELAGAPDVVGCSLTINPRTQTVPADGGSFHVTVSGPCGWSAASGVDWIVVTHGQGADIGSITFDVLPNSGGERQGSLTIGEASVTIVQPGPPPPPPPPAPPQPPPDPEPDPEPAPAPPPPAPPPPAPSPAPAPPPPAPAPPPPPAPAPPPPPAPAPPPPAPSPAPPAPPSPPPAPPEQPVVCTFQATASPSRVPASGGTVTITVTTGGTCAWSPSSPDSWIAVPGGQRTGNGSVAVTVASNTGAARSGRVAIGTASVTIAQDAAPLPVCSFKLSPSQTAIPAFGGEYTLEVATDATCKWQASASDEWINVSSESMVGSGTVWFAAAYNRGGPRQGRITVGNASITLSQEGCVSGITPATQRLPSGTASGRLSVSALEGCSWSVTAPAWIVGLPSSGTGSAELAFRVEANTGGERSGSIVIGGRSVQVTQAGATTALRR